MRGDEESGGEAWRGRRVREREGGDGGEMAGIVKGAAVGSDEPKRARRRCGHGREHGAVMGAVASAAGRELQLCAAGKQHRQGPHREKGDDEDGQGTPHR